MSQVAIFGANGYLGRHIALDLSQSGESTIRLSDQQTFSFDQRDLYCQIDLRDVNAVRDFVEGCEYIFFSAGLTGTSQGFENYREFVEINEVGLLNVLDACQRHGNKPKIIFPSSRLVYKGKQNTPLREDDEKEFKTIYALNKYAGEQYLKMYAHCFGVPYTVFRICVPYGSRLPASESYGTLSHFISQARDKGEVVIFGDGEQKRTLVYIGDLVRILIQAGMNSITDTDVFNVGGADALAIREVAEKIALKFDAHVRFVPWPPLAEKIESGDTIFDATKLSAIFNIEYQHTFDDWLSRLGEES